MGRSTVFILPDSCINFMILTKLSHYLRNLGIALKLITEYGEKWKDFVTNVKKSRTTGFIVAPFRLIDNSTATTFNDKFNFE